MIRGLFSSAVSFVYIETRFSPESLAATRRGFALITRTARARASYPSCVAVYPRDSRSRVFYVAHPVRSIPAQERAGE